MQMRIILTLIFVFLTASCGASQLNESSNNISKQAGEIGNTVVQFGNNAIGFSGDMVSFVSEQAIAPFLSNTPQKPDNVEIGFTPKYIPVRIAVDIHGNVLVSSSSALITDVGAFDVAANKKIISQNDERLLIIQIDDREEVLKLPPLSSNEEFTVDFSDNQKVYRLLSFKQDEHRNIILELETLD